MNSGGWLLLSDFHFACMRSVLSGNCNSDAEYKRAGDRGHGFKAQRLIVWAQCKAFFFAVWTHGLQLDEFDAGTWRCVPAMVVEVEAKVSQPALLEDADFDDLVRRPKQIACVRAVRVFEKVSE
jgi:hypothetical protein